jgi:hypothetical protein
MNRAQLIQKLESIIKEPDAIADFTADNTTIIIVAQIINLITTLEITERTNPNALFDKNEVARILSEMLFFFQDQEELMRFLIEEPTNFDFIVERLYRLSDASGVDMEAIMMEAEGFFGPLDDLPTNNDTPHNLLNTAIIPIHNTPHNFPNDTTENQYTLEHEFAFAFVNIEGDTGNFFTEYL